MRTRQGRLLFAAAILALPAWVWAQTGQQPGQPQDRPGQPGQPGQTQPPGQQPGQVQPGTQPPVTPQPGMTRQTSPTNPRPWNEPAERVQKASDLIGKNVVTTGGEEVGEVENLIVDLESGRITYAILDFDGKLHPVPAQAMELPSDASKFRVSTTKDKLKAHAFEGDAYPNFGDRSWAARVHGEFGVQPYWERGGAGMGSTTPGAGTVSPGQQHPWYQFTTKWYKATDLIGKDVDNQQGEDLGKIEDLAVDPDRHRVVYAVLSFGGFLGMGDKFFALPWTMIQSPSEDKIVLNLDKDRLKGATGFDKDNWPNMANERWATETSSFYGQRPYWEEPRSDMNRDRDINRDRDVNRDNEKRDDRP